MRKIVIKIALLPAFFLPAGACIANTPPTADAGPVQRIIAPVTTAVLMGSGSDKEGPVTFQWTQVRGNTTAAIADPASDTTAVANLQTGVYTFVLTVKDLNGAIRRDTTHISVLKKLKWVVNGIDREALVHSPTGGTGAPPLIFAFHGQGGTDLGFAQRAFEISWPEAVVVYPQGLPTLGIIDTSCRQSGWQKTVGEVNCLNGFIDQDLKFFDLMLSRMKKKYGIDTSLVFVHGWSSGAGFVYNALWPARAKKLAAISPAGATLDTIVGKKPKPMIHVAGTLDDKALFTDQQQSVLEVRTLNKCDTAGAFWAKGTSGLLGTRYASPVNAPVVFLQYNGDHNYPFTVPPLIVRFFKEIAAGINAPLIAGIIPDSRIK